MPPQPIDIVERMRGLRYVHVPVASELMNEAATAIETMRWQLKIRENIIGRLVAENGRLRDGGAEGRETVCPHVRGTVTQHCSLNFTLTDEERGAIETADAYMSAAGCHNTNVQKTLRGLLERLAYSDARDSMDKMLAATRSVQLEQELTPAELDALDGERNRPLVRPKTLPKR